MPTYEYTGGAAVVFTTISSDGHTWLAEPGATITLDEAIDHPDLRLVSEKKSAKQPENESPVEGDEPEEK